MENNKIKEALESALNLYESIDIRGVKRPELIKLQGMKMAIDNAIKLIEA